MQINYKVYIIIICIFIFLGNFILGQANIVKTILFSIYTPIVLGMLGRDFFLGSDSKIILNKALFLSTIGFPWLLLTMYSGDSLTEFVGIYSCLTFLFISISYYLGEREKYIGEFNYPLYVVMLILFCYILSIYCSIGISGGINEGTFYYLLGFFFVLFSIFTLLFLYLLSRPLNNFIKWCISFIETFMAMCFALFFFCKFFLSLFMLDVITFQPSLSLFIEALFLGFGLGFLLQEIILIGAYFPSKHKNRTAWGIRYTNKILINRVKEQKYKLRYLLIFFVIGLGYMLLVHFTVVKSCLNIGIDECQVNPHYYFLGLFLGVTIIGNLALSVLNKFGPFLFRR